MANPHPRDLPAEPSVPQSWTYAWIVVNTLVAMVLGTGITVLLHELAHWVTGAALGSQATLFAFGVTYHPPLTGTAAAGAAAAGPVASLVIGSVMQVLQPFRFRGDFAHLLWIWVAVTSLMQAAVYLAITPYGGDVATIVRELPNLDVVFDASPNHQVKLASGGSNFRIMGIGAEEFPKLPTSGDDKAYTLEQGELATMLSNVSYAQSTDETR